MQKTYLTATTETFDAVVLQATLPVLLDFWAPWCAPCLSLGRVIEQIIPEYADKVLVVKINADENPELCQRHGLRSLPRLSLYQHGQEIEIIEERTRARLERYLESRF
ncbi:thioredoxin family protein [Paraburkholderia sp. BCC1885]|uniref:thioredoxin family protein n=1 Tax=Paraburkholderia sp. BCC1885 TaxID=2562669 RepID=UPI0011831D22|nr:thioredoxin family protein [Paraburkholderia sp. BCC1885]